MNNPKKENINYRIVLTAGFVLYLAWVVYPTIYSFLKLNYFLPYYFYQLIPAIFPFIMGIVLVLIYKRKMTLNAALSGLAVLLVHLFVMSRYYPFIDIRRTGDFIYLGILVLKLPIAAYIGAYVAAKMKKI